ncbi:MAG: DPP IV N-terminal domain-containing protein [Bacteroidota bacterium]|nr:DPP IV N-terminal domain-containing protein [Bacteroidota bacterium]MDP4246345.1 DPP IV N-terminal domain-containing protein [Bacteroidota bacterium]MDP4253518.1 DPP IV N-terminal domain-containing protein [Bacteroidota bacterium]MDP4258112.1 DPP IV N-terminal domain-containing protein [Bacteroidota bacterium]
MLLFSGSVNRGLQVSAPMFLLVISMAASGQPGAGRLKWTTEGNAYFKIENGGIDRIDLPDRKETVIVSREMLTPAGQTKALGVRNFAFSNDGKKLLIFTNTKRVWRYNTRGDYWVLDLESKQLKQLGRDRPASSLLFAKFSPDGSKVAYVSEHNIYLEELAAGPGDAVKCLTSTEGTRKLINGTFDWVYEEELDCRDGFRWSPDGRHIAYWQIDANKIRDYLMLNTTDSLYPFVVPVEYPTVGEAPSPYKIGVVDVGTGTTKWMDIPGDPRQTYLPRMEWADNSSQLILQQFNRKQNDGKILLSDVATGATTQLYEEQDSAFIECKGAWQDGVVAGWDWLNGGKEFLWVTEKDGWRHIYRISRDGKKETLVTKGNYDIITVSLIDEKNNYVYFIASPANATQKYLFRTRLDGKGKLERLSPENEPGTHEYDISPNGLYAMHDFSNANTEDAQEWVSLPGHAPIGKSADIPAKVAEGAAKKKVNFFTVHTADGVDMDGWIVKPANFDSTKKYPVLFFVYGEPASQTVLDRYGNGNNFLYAGELSRDGYIYISLDNRGTPAPKGRAWRKALYRHIGRLNIRDQAMAAREIMKWPFVDTSRIAVWGWSGGAATTLNLMFQYPELYKTGIAVAAITDQVTYDNIYEERYMGLVTENPEDYTAASPLTYAKNLRGNLLYIHGTGDDNVHYKNAELLLNALIKYNKVFQFMAYPNRSHGIFEGEGTRRHLSTLYTEFLKRNCPGGGR